MAVGLKQSFALSHDSDAKQEFLTCVLNCSSQWIRTAAYYKWLGRGCEHGRDFEDWRQAKAELTALLEDYWHTTCLFAADGDREIIAGRVTQRQARFILQSLAAPRLHLITLEEDEHEARPPVSRKASEAMDIKPGIARIVRRRSATAEERELAQLHVDPLSLLSSDDRSRYAGQWVAIRRSGSDRGRVIAHADSGAEASRLAVAGENGRRGLIAVRFVPIDDATLPLF